MQADAITAFDALILLLAFLAVIYGLVKGFTNILVRVLAFAGALLIIPFRDKSVPLFDQGVDH